jgi:hypothetical protein
MSEKIVLEKKIAAPLEHFHLEPLAGAEFDFWGKRKVTVTFPYGPEKKVSVPTAAE